MYKKIVAGALALTLTFGGAGAGILSENSAELFSDNSITASAEDLVFNDFKYSVNSNDTITIKEYTGKGGDVEIPGTIDGKAVVTLSSYLFNKNEDITSVTVPENVTRIENYVFTGCKNLTKVNLPSTLKTVGYDLFRNCINLKEADLSKSAIESLSQTTFYGDTSLTEVKLPQNLKSIPGYFLDDCASLTKVTMGNKVTTIGACAFRNCTNLSEINFSAELESISAQAFKGCTSLTEVELSNGVLDIYDSAFSGCTKLEKINFPDSIKSIGTYAFEDCVGLTDIELPKFLTQVSNGTFYGCKNLETVTIKSMVKTIGNSAFMNCRKLKEVNIAEGVTKIGEQAFQSCDDLESITIPKSVATFGTRAIGYISASAINEYMTVNVYHDSEGENYVKEKGIKYKYIHEFSDWTQSKAPTCTEEGEETRSCTVEGCEETETRTIDALGHKEKEPVIENEVAPTCENNGSYDEVVYCSECGEELSRVTKSVDAKGHVYTTQVVKPTYFAKGYTLHTCSVCEKSYKDKETAVLKLAQTKGVKASAVTVNSAKLTWTKVKDADGYEVYRYNTKTKKWVKLGTSKTTSYTAKKLASGTSYKFAVKAYKKSGANTVCGALSASACAVTVPTKTTITKAVAGNKKAAITWKKVTSAKKYQVLVKTSANGKYKVIAATTKNTYTKTKLTSKKTYYFAVKAIGSTGKASAISAAKAVKVK